MCTYIFYLWFFFFFFFVYTEPTTYTVFARCQTDVKLNWVQKFYGKTNGRILTHSTQFFFLFFFSLLTFDSRHCLVGNIVPPMWCEHTTGTIGMLKLNFMTIFSLMKTQIEMIFVSNRRIFFISFSLIRIRNRNISKSLNCLDRIRKA